MARVPIYSKIVPSSRSLTMCSSNTLSYSVCGPLTREGMFQIWDEDSQEDACNPSRPVQIYSRYDFKAGIVQLYQYLCL